MKSFEQLAQAHGKERKRHRAAVAHELPEGAQENSPGQACGAVLGDSP
jgi:hypothetical protein